MTQITRIIFDNDGVNIDSEHLAMQVMDDFGYDLVARYIGEPIEGLQRGDIYKTYKGVSSNDIITDLIEKFDLPVEVICTDYNIQNTNNAIEELSDQLTKATIKEFEGNLYTLPNFVKTMKFIYKQFGFGNIALCTTSRADRMHATEHAKDPETGDNADWAKYFPDKDSLRISGYGHANKYEYFRELHPDWKPEETAIVEDTAGSTKKAIDTGFKNIIGIVASKFQCNTEENKREEIAKLLKAGARIIVTDYGDIPKVIEWMNNGMDMDNLPMFKSDVHNNQGDLVTLNHNLDI
jgi:beta-phosphoglucomutase-like phosphatase (HAD superfamily)